MRKSIPEEKGGESAEEVAMRRKLGDMSVEGKREESSETWKSINIKDIDIGEQIGGGGFAIVYEGRWKQFRVALKTLFDPRVDETSRQEFMDELFVMSQLDHPNIVTLYGACVKTPDLCMVMELCDDSLFNTIHTKRVQLTEKSIVGIATQIASGLEYLHSQSPSIIHRDIKSHNVLVTEDLDVKLCDFGLVSTNITSAGTPAYMAPELLSSKCFSRKVDVFAFAVLMWEMFTQAIPFTSWDPADIRDFYMQGKRLQLPQSGCPKQCCQLIERCWDGDSQRRPEFKNIHRALTRIHSTLRDVTHTDEMSYTDSFDMLKSTVSKK